MLLLPVLFKTLSKNVDFKSEFPAKAFSLQHRRSTGEQAQRELNSSHLKDLGLLSEVIALEKREYLVELIVLGEAAGCRGEYITGVPEGH